METKERDITSYPEGFQNLCKELNIPNKTFASEAEKEQYVWALIDFIVRW
jgi:hypothetical protein